MSTKFLEKNIKLSLELDRYLARNPSAVNRIPRGAYVIVTVKGDGPFNRKAKILLKKVRSGRQKYIEARKDGARWVLEPMNV